MIQIFEQCFPIDHKNMSHPYVQGGVHTLYYDRSYNEDQLF